MALYKFRIIIIIIIINCELSVIDFISPSRGLQHNIQEHKTNKKLNRVYTVRTRLRIHAFWHRKRIFRREKV